MYKNKKILIMGGAKSGMAAARLLSKHNQVTLTDINKLSKEEAMELKRLNVDVIITHDQENILIDDFEMIVKNPGIVPDHPLLIKAKDKKILITNEVEVSYHYLSKDTTIIGITGSNGKTTVTTIIYNILKEMGKKVYLAGNIGIPLSSIVEEIEPSSILVIEISDHQLLNFKDFKTDISVLTNIVKTHLDYHKGFENYKNAKSKIFNNHTSLDVAIINKQDNDSLDITNNILSNKIYFNNEDNYYDNDYIYINKERIVAIEDIKIVGTHNYENILASLLVLNEFYLDKEVIKKYLSNFSGVEHRIEFVLEKNGIKYYNDSKSTNPTSTITALNTFKNPIHLILGGKNREQNFEELSNHIRGVKCIYAVGEASNLVYDFALKHNIPCIKCKTLKGVIKSLKNSNELEKGDIVLLSPASASLDQYKNFEERGEDFKKLIT